MRCIKIVYFVIGVISFCVFCLSVSEWTQAQNVPPEHSIAQAPRQTPQPVRPQQAVSVRNQGEYGGIRIDWKRLGLSREQQDQIAQKRREFQINTAGIREELKFAEQDLRTELIKDPVDRAKIDSLLAEVARLKQDLSVAAAQNLLAIRGILTPDQLEKLVEIRLQIPKEFEGLKLNSDQRSQVQEIMKNAIKQNRTIAADLLELQEELRETLLAKEIDAEKLKQLQANIAEKEFALEKARVDMLLQFQELLTPEQRQRYRQFRGKRQEISPKR